VVDQQRAGLNEHPPNGFLAARNSENDTQGRFNKTAWTSVIGQRADMSGGRSNDVNDPEVERPILP
jgi:hypothetical protein